ncbi:MAG: acyl-CoA thioesterase [Oscillospiraceae bacterium]|nr:acyl-CoA thioesterase [Oscillospiraceae bacterium]
MATEIIIDVRYPDCDSMQIVHHAVYPIWYEMGRMDFFDKCGYDYVKGKEIGIDPAMVNLELNYGAPVTFPGKVTLKTFCTLCSGKKIAFRYELYREGDDKPCATAKSLHIWVGNGKSVNIEEEKPEMFAAYAKQVEA